MGKLSPADRAIVLGLVAVLLVLLGLAVAHRSDPARPTPVGGTAPSTSPSGSAPSRAAPAASSSPTGAAAGASTTSMPPTPTTGAPTLGPVSAVGDSLMLDIQPDLQADLPGVRVDGMVSRQFEAGIAVVDAERSGGTLGRVLVVELGTNGTVTDADFDAMMQAAAGLSRVVFVNVAVPRSWEAADNAVLSAGVARYPGRAVLADWFSLASGHPEWFAADQVHLQPAGAAALAGLIAGVV